MGKLLDFAAAAFLILLMWAVQYLPYSPLLWIASTTPAFIALRSILVILLVWFMIYTPESKLIRTPVGIIAMICSAWLATASFDGSIQMFDSLSLLMATVALMLSLLETKPKEEPFKSVRLAQLVAHNAAHDTRVFSKRAFRLGRLMLADVDMILENYLRQISANQSRTDAKPQHRHA